MARHTALTSSNPTLGALSVALGAASWGLFWIPLRYLDGLGVQGLWAVALVMLCALLPSATWMIRRRTIAQLVQRDNWLTGSVLGISTVLYFTGVIFSDVIRVIFLFYLLPVWATLAARVVYGEVIQRAQLAVIAIALVGLWLLLGGGNRLPLPNNAGDWCGLGAGLCWGVSLALLRGRNVTSPIATTGSAMAIGGVLAACVALTLSMTLDTPQLRMPTPDQLSAAAPAALGFSVFVLFPAMFSQIWGARLIPAPTAALLTMSEILVATLSAYLLIGTDLTLIGGVGGGLILLAVVVDLWWKRDRIVLAYRH